VTLAWNAFRDELEVDLRRLSSTHSDKKIIMLMDRQSVDMASGKLTTKTSCVNQLRHKRKNTVIKATSSQF
jgi:hypothetical protein